MGKSHKTVQRLISQTLLAGAHFPERMKNPASLIQLPKGSISKEEIGLASGHKMAVPSLRRKMKNGNSKEGWRTDNRKIQLSSK